LIVWCLFACLVFVCLSGLCWPLFVHLYPSSIYSQIAWSSTQIY
jgi:hypothetical protein